MSGVLCLGEPIVDLIAQVAPGRAPDAGDGPRFTPHLGGTAANVAVTAARAGARVGLAGAVGDDRWAGWLREQLVAEGVDVSGCVAVAGTATPQVVVGFGADGEPAY
jgi:sugar/nucleoside kinase (ribokinase family)